MTDNVTDNAAAPLTARTSPHEVRTAFRAGIVRPTAGLALGYAQANLVALPRPAADDFRRFAELNPRPCPLLDVLDGTTVPAIAPAADVRTDLPLYRIWREGELVDEVADASDAYAECADGRDLVTFLIGCSFTFEAGLVEAGIPVRHIDAGRNVPMYRTDRACRPAGAFAGPLVVSLRAIPAGLVDAACEISGRYPLVHGAPVHVGDPAALGIADIDRPDFGDPPVIEPGDVPVFWACGVTPQAALAASRPPFAITHAPGHMFVSDAPNERYLV